MKFYKCPTCGNVIKLVNGDIDHITCCGKPMEELTANTTDATTEKHLPVFEKVGNEIVVKVGEIDHPMDEDHYIMWIAQVSDDKIIRQNLAPSDAPEAKFPYAEGATIYAYCNKHGLWKSTVE